MGIPWLDGNGVRERANSGSGAGDHVIGQGRGWKLERMVWRHLVSRYCNKQRQQCEPATKVHIPEGVGSGRERVLVVSM